jgi:hypothetical protein
MNAEVGVFNAAEDAKILSPMEKLGKKEKYRSNR